MPTICKNTTSMGRGKMRSTAAAAVPINVLGYSEAIR